jgi:hypothetical protein
MNEPKGPKQVPVHYQKTSGFRNIYVSGAYGGAALGNGLIYMNLFTDRPPIPTLQVLEPVSGGETEISREGKEGLIRDVEIGCIIDVGTAKVLVEWLQNKIDLLEKKA